MCELWPCFLSQDFDECFYSLGLCLLICLSMGHWLSASCSCLYEPVERGSSNFLLGPNSATMWSGPGTCLSLDLISPSVRGDAITQPCDIIAKILRSGEYIYKLFVKSNCYGPGGVMKYVCIFTRPFWELEFSKLICYQQQLRTYSELCSVWTWSTCNTGPHRREQTIWVSLHITLHALAFHSRWESTICSLGILFCTFL